MEKILNAFLYCVYLMEVRLHYLSNKINPAWLLLYIPSIKKRFKRKGQDPWEEVNKIFTDKETGFSIWTAQVVVGAVIMGVLIGSFFLVDRIFNFYEYVPEIYFFIFAGVSMYICHLFILKNDKYLEYFEHYEKWSKSQKRKYIIISFLVIIATIAYLFLSMMCC